MTVCKICNKEFQLEQGLSHHLKSKHNIDKKLYYDAYIKSNEEGLCKICGNKTTFAGLTIGYRQYCSQSCVHLDKDVQNKYNLTMKNRYGYEHCFQNKDIQEKAHISLITNKNYKSNFSNPGVIEKLSKIRINKINQFEKDNNCTQYKKITDKYNSTVWYKLRLPKLKLGKDCFIENKYLGLIDEYMTLYNSQLHHVSKAEKTLVQYIKSFYTKKVIENNRSIIKPYELDIYLPDINLAIEYNSIWFHSTKNRPEKYYHINKSILCKEKNIFDLFIFMSLKTLRNKNNY